MATFDLGLVRGRDGVNGRNGDPGAPGRDGRDGRDGVPTDAVMFAEYGVTQYEDVANAYSDGKAILCLVNSMDGSYVAQLQYTDFDGVLRFAYHLNGAALKVFDVSASGWSDIKDVLYFPAAHANTHAIGGADPITPGDIGAAQRYYFGTTEIEPGTASNEPENALHFVYER